MCLAVSHIMQATLHWHIANSCPAMVLAALAYAGTHPTHALSIFHKQKEKNSLACPLTLHGA